MELSCFESRLQKYGVAGMAYPKISLIPDFKQENGAVLDFPHVFTETHAPARSNILRRELGRQRGAKLVPRKKSSPNLETSRLSRSLFPSFRSASITLHLPDSPSPNASFHLLCRRLLQIATIQANQ